VAPGFTTDQTENETVSLATQNDRDIQEAENERAAREHIFRGAHLSYWPTIDIVGQYSVLSKFNNYLDFYKTFERNNLNVGVVLTIPLFAAKTSATAALAKSQLDVAEATVSKKRQEVRLDVVQKSRSWRKLGSTRGGSPCRKSSRTGWTRATNGSPSWMRILPANRRSLRFCRLPASWRKYFNRAR